ncbi:hypothetical protein [Ulvibacterium marinum]|uniref:Uncharacterized protein n=1 Tax=Ulvibacterium marinum TaxID=2419782 RepID=A0A3B0C0L7_9FLAO|nr:hypothetical protein [Ulvibacterium marinum]RKN77844.1 hypothetical protein D7Z94_21635 [Ulvibacterium marinum]
MKKIIDHIADWLVALNEKKAVIMKIEKESLGREKDYFDDHPIIYKDYQKWARKRDSVPDQK